MSFNRSRWPYNSSTSPPADIIIRTADDVNFHAHKVVLSLASPFFENMFSLPQPLTQHPVTTKDDLPVIPVSEHSHIILSLLCYVYPISDPQTLGLDSFDQILGAAIKYQFTEAAQIARGALKNFVYGESSSTLQIFAVGCRHHDENMTMYSATSWTNSRTSRIAMQEANARYNGVRVQVDPTTFDQTIAGSCYIPSMAQCVSAGTYFRLIQYTQDGKPTSFLSVPSELAKPVTRKTVEEVLSQHPFTREDADIVLESSDGVRFPVHRAVLGCNVGMTDVDQDSFGSLLKTAAITQPAPDSVKANSSELPRISVGESGVVLSILMTLCYPPFPGNTLQDQSAAQICDDTMISVIKAAGKYKFTSVVHAFRARLEQLIIQNPLEAYCVACALEWRDEAKRAATRLAFRPTPCIYLPIYESLTAKDYHTLLKFHWESQSTVRTHLIKRYPLAEPPGSGFGTLRSAPRSTWLTREDIPLCATWPALLEYQIDTAISIQRSSSYLQKNGVGAFEWDSMVQQMVETESEISEALQKLTLG